MTERTFKNYMGILFIVLIGIFAITEYYELLDKFIILKILIFLALYAVIILFTRERPKEKNT